MDRCSYAWLALATACAGTATPTRPSVEPRPAPSSDVRWLDDLPRGECGGFATLGRTEPLPLLGGRLRVRAPEGAADSPRAHNIMAAPPSAEMETRLFLDRDGVRLVVFGQELYRRPTDDLVAAARADVGEGYRVVELDVEAPLRAVVAVPRELDLSDEAVDVAIAYTVTADALVQRVSFYVTPEAATSGGCERLGVELARTLTAGGLLLPDEPGPRVLEDGLGLDLASDHRLVVQEGPDFAVHRVYPLLPLGRGEGMLGIYLGHHPSFRPRPDATRTPVELLGQSVEWHDWERRDLHHRHALVPFGHAAVHVFMAASEPATLERLSAIASSLRTGVAPRPLAACPPSSPLPAVEVDAEVLAIPALQTLLSASELAFHMRTWDLPRVPSTAAFFALADHPRAREAFLHLAVHGTTAGRIYGLAGLYLADRARFDPIVCAVRDALEPTVTVRGACGTEARPVSTLIEAADGVRGEPHWSARQWQAALRRGAADVRGGGVSWRLLVGPPEQGEIARNAWALGGEGYVPPLVATDRSAERLAPFAPARVRAVRMATTTYGGVCRTRNDGRVACWGSTPLSERRGASLLPESVRWPTDLAVDLGLGCVLDANGQRACFALLEPALQARAAACPSAPAPTEPVVRRFDDGPWRALGVADDVCGIRPDGSLVCFRSSDRYVPAWAALEGEGIGTPYAVPIEGDVRGIAPGHLFDAYAWTSDGTIWKWDHDAPPRAIGRVEGVVDVTAGNDGRVAFARTSDGRVLVRGLRRGRDGAVSWWSRFGDDEGPWIEVEALRGAHVTLGGHHGCVLMPDRTVQCWGQRSGFATTELDEHDAPPARVPELDGASALILGEWSTCGVMRGGSLRCIGTPERIRTITNGAAREDSRGPVDVRVDRVAASIR